MLVDNRSTDRWNELGEVLYGNLKKSRLGYRMSLSQDGNIVAVGAPMAGDDKMGQVTVYRYDNSTGYRQWKHLGQTIMAQEPSPDDFFGAELDLSADGLILAIGQQSQDKSKTFSERRGRLAIFRYSNKSWSAMGDEIHNILNRVAMNADGTRVAFTTQQVRGSGGGYSQVFEFDKNFGDWRPLGGIISQVWQSGGGSDISMSASGNIILLGAPDEVNNTVRLYKLRRRSN